ncbi:hypothetical protein DFJ43DRAFT_89663 [Lentinula guzmanii]|uniref:Uncharacterized protein n=1 Tax=Lentinula guzmanii TaxID=2804957 RepID=A0AA38MUE9_9AGAR|nr:hypothetical protein DFJ43DRAFT_89663 [Lentinula guzmanii]
MPQVLTRTREPHHTTPRTTMVYDYDYTNDDDFPISESQGPLTKTLPRHSPVPSVTTIRHSSNLSLSLSLDCARSACSGCWTAFAISKICDEGEYCIRCISMTEGCAIVAADDFALIRFQELDVRGLVASKSKLKFSSYPGCRIQEC